MQAVRNSLPISKGRRLPSVQKCPSRRHLIQTNIPDAPSRPTLAEHAHHSRESPGSASTDGVVSDRATPSPGQLQERIKSLRLALTEHSRQLGAEADRRFTVLGMKINEVTGYREVEQLKLEVAKREDDLKALREAAKAAKDAYDQAVTTRSDAQRDVNSLLERKHSWTDADVSRFTQLVRADHSSTAAVVSTAAQLKQAEMAVDKGFSDLMQTILERYHEEQVWSDKIRSVSTWGSIVALAANLIVFVGAIAFIEPWKRRRLVQGLEERITEMMDRVEGSVVALSGRIDGVEGHLVANVPVSSLPDSSSISTAAPAAPARYLLPTILPWPPVDAIRQPSTERDMAAVGLCGLAGGVVIATILNALVYK